ncbi:hypothetical protein CC1G_14688 [Coprinopsis cinerea okayama7|uniref:Uncharacterized protein n=1 Tax=Coprinopsis cinerea (strain Okayama-7 / 130 / ATCC MYA-4618 / FGSC 9003) TaxID=240176 RepID=D6RMK2_COPC7|nr:hypothetical protein CC1G_14688 [Coprinopsis cinerea okayama7\|eukprot:XP_002911259.1 hypothetical protein CC1G_14688 [Coprinopsis cinerea okayama7\
MDTASTARRRRKQLDPTALRLGPSVSCAGRGGGKGHWAKSLVERWQAPVLGNELLPPDDLMVFEAEAHITGRGERLTQRRNVLDNGNCGCGEDDLT